MRNLTPSPPCSVHSPPSSVLFHHLAHKIAKNTTLPLFFQLIYKIFNFFSRIVKKKVVKWYFLQQHLKKILKKGQKRPKKAKNTPKKAKKAPKSAIFLLPLFTKKVVKKW